MPAVSEHENANTAPSSANTINGKPLDSKKQCCRCFTSELDAGRKLQLCGGCKVLLYCSKDCQVAHWSSHRPVCKANQAGQEAARKLDLSKIGPTCPHLPSPGLSNQQLYVAVGGWLDVVKPKLFDVAMDLSGILPFASGYKEAPYYTNIVLDIKHGTSLTVTEVIARRVSTLVAADKGARQSFEIAHQDCRKVPGCPGGVFVVITCYRVMRIVPFAIDPRYRESDPIFLLARGLGHDWVEELNAVAENYA